MQRRSTTLISELNASSSSHAAFARLRSNRRPSCSTRSLASRDMMPSIVAEILSAAARAEREYDPGFSMITLARDVVELGEPELGLQIANDANPEPGGAWFAYLATLHAMVGRADDV